MTTTRTQKAPGTAPTVTRGKTNNLTASKHIEEFVMTTIPQSPARSKAAAALDGWRSLADLIPTSVPAWTGDTVSETFIRPAWCTSAVLSPEDEGLDPRTAEYPVQADPGHRVSVSSPVSVPLALYRGRADRLDGERVIVPASASVQLRQHHGSREPMVCVNRTEHVITNGELLEDERQILKLQTAEARELGETLIAAADLADAAAYDTALEVARFIVGQADAEARVISLPETLEVGKKSSAAGGTR